MTLEDAKWFFYTLSAYAICLILLVAVSAFLTRQDRKELREYRDRLNKKDLQ